MSDQAENLRQLVRARRLWRELMPDDAPAPVVGCEARLSGGKWGGARPGGLAVSFVLALRQLFGRRARR